MGLALVVGEFLMMGIFCVSKAAYELLKGK